MSDHIVSVGDLFDPDRTHYNIEAPQWRITSEPLMEAMTLDDYDSDGERIPFDVLKVHVQLLQFYPHPTRAEIAQHHEPGVTMQFALIPGQHAMMLGYQFGDGQWSDASFQIVRQSEPAGLPDPQGRFHIPIWVALIDSATGILCAAQHNSWPPEFAGAVRDALAAQEQAGKGMSREVRAAAGEAEIQKWVRDYPTPDALVEAEARLIVRGGKRSAILRHNP